MGDLKHTPLYAEHVALHAKLVPFAGFEMPVQYPTGIRAEHEAVRTAAGLIPGQWARRARLRFVCDDQ